MIARRVLPLFHAFLLSVCLSGCGSNGSSSVTNPPPSGGNLFSATPINDLGSATYKGFPGGLFPNGSNTMPVQYAADGTGFAKSVQPLDAKGLPSATGAIVLLAIGLSNTTQEWCCPDPDGSAPNASNPNSWTFMGQASVDANGVAHATGLNDGTLRIVDGAKGGQAAKCWVDPSAVLCGSQSEYDRIRDNQLKPRGLTENHVQAVWIKLANASPTVSLPDPNADAFALEISLGQTLRALKVRYPNLRLGFLSSRIYGGYALTNLNPEPFAYESGFSVKFLIEAQINQIASGQVDSRAGDLDYGAGKAPWISWGPYLWASGTQQRSDGLTWVIDDFEPGDRTHPSQSGETKVANLLLEFFKTSNQSKCWFLKNAVCQ